ncbi:hypothetical protein U1Q18_001958 [Sarracenia purpurea var. burkii]
MGIKTSTPLPFDSNPSRSLASIVSFTTLSCPIVMSKTSPIVNPNHNAVNDPHPSPPLSAIAEVVDIAHRHDCHLRFLSRLVMQNPCYLSLSFPLPFLLNPSFAFFSIAFKQL